MNLFALGGKQYNELGEIMKKITFVVLLLILGTVMFATGNISIPDEFCGDYVSNEMFVFLDGEEPISIPMIITAEITEDNIRIRLLLTDVGSSSIIDYKEMLSAGGSVVNEYTEPGYYEFTYKNRVKASPGVVAEGAATVFVLAYKDSIAFKEATLNGLMETVILFYHTGV